MNDKFEEAFGPHLTLDLYSCNKSKISDINFIYQLLDELPDYIGMKKISKPNLTFYGGSENSFDKGGISGFILIATSHITIHTFIEQEHAFIDIFSCKEFDVAKTEKYLIKALGAKKADKNLFTRGLEFHKNIPVIKRFIKKERNNINKKDF